MITENGERLGEVRDYEFDPETFALTALSVPPGMNVVGEILMIAGDKVLTIGEDMIVVAADRRSGQRWWQRPGTRWPFELIPVLGCHTAMSRGKDTRIFI